MISSVLYIECGMVTPNLFFVLLVFSTFPRVPSQLRLYVVDTKVWKQPLAALNPIHSPKLP